MTFIVKCDKCGKQQECEIQSANPWNEEKGERWYSKTIDGKTEHACCLEHTTKGLVWPE